MSPGAPRDPQPRVPVDEVGLRVVHLTGADAADPARAASAHPEANVLRLTDAVAGAGAPEGFFTRPLWIAWIASVPDGTDSLLALQRRSTRQGTRVALRRLDTADVTTRRVVPEAAYREWLALYQGQLSRMTRGVDVVSAREAEVLDPSTRHGLLGVRVDGRLVAGCVFRAVPEAEALHVRFAAVDPALRDRDLPQAMYARLADVARDLGLRHLVLGRDVNLYGALLKPGLCAFKLRLGFRAIPAEVLSPDVARDVTDRVVSLRGMDAPAAFFAYPPSGRPAVTAAWLDPTSPAALGLVLVTGQAFDDRGLSVFPPHLRVTLPE